MVHLFNATAVHPTPQFNNSAIYGISDVFYGTICVKRGTVDATAFALK
jgi:hypothetical protein